jgi:porin
MTPSAKTLSPLFSLPLLFWAITSIAGEEVQARDYREETLTGDWGGIRSSFANKGFEWEGALKIDSLRNRGALRDGTKSISHLDIKLKMDFEKAFGWTGSSGMLNVISDAGHGLNGEHVGSFLGVSNIEVPFPTTTRIFQAWVQQSLGNERLFVLAGIYPVDSEFQVLDSAGVFIKPEYGPTGDFSLTRGPSIFNNAAFGIRTKVQSSDKTTYAQWALMDGIPNDPNHPKRTSVRFDDGDGAFNMLEAGWLPEADNEQFTGHAKLALGLWGYTVREDDQRDVANIDAGNMTGSARKHRQKGGYLLGERTVLRMDDDRFLTVFARYAWTDGYSSPLKNTLNLGVHVKGAISSRPDDVLGLAWSRASTSARWRDAQAVNNIATEQAETALELTYRYVVTPWFAVQPNYQHIVNPGATDGTSNARILGARFEFVL